MYLVILCESYLGWQDLSDFVLLSLDANQKIEKTKSYIRQGQLALTFWVSLDFIAHAVFIVEFWLISRKLEQVQLEREEPANSDTLKFTLVGAISVWTLTSFIAVYIGVLNWLGEIGDTVLKELVELKQGNYWWQWSLETRIFESLVLVPVLICILLMADAIRRMFRVERNSLLSEVGGPQINKYMILVQFFIYITFGAAITMNMLLDTWVSFYTAQTLTFLTVLGLTSSLMHLANLQFTY
jgi:hypothetical protein